jgi:hypothetical protein
MNFNDCVLECCRTPKFIKEYDRLQGSNLTKVLIPQPDTRPPIVRMIDEATGYDKVRTNLDEQAHKEMQEFIGFIFDCVWIPLLFSVTNGEENDSGKT